LRTTSARALLLRSRKLSQRPKAKGEAIRDLARFSQARTSPLEPVIAQHVREQIAPRWVVLLDQLDFRSRRHRFTARSRRAATCASSCRSKYTKPIDPIALGEALAHVFPMLPGTTGKIARHSDVKNPARLAGGNVDMEDFG
jgi:hypothetical protein